MTGSDELILAAAGARKTTLVVDRALACNPDPVLILTYTDQNQAEIRQRLIASGKPFSHVRVMGWLSFLLNEWVRPYQGAMTNRPNVIRGLNFHADRKLFGRLDDVRTFVDRNRDARRNGLAVLASIISSETERLPVLRLERMFSHILIDEVQDLAGYDLDLLDLLFASSIRVTGVGDPRQFLFPTNYTNKHAKYRGAGLIDWCNTRRDVEVRSIAESYRCSQEICDFADSIFADHPYESTVSRLAIENPSGYSGVEVVGVDDAAEYLRDVSPQVLRYDKNRSIDGGSSAINIGVSKGSTFDHVLALVPKSWISHVQKGTLTSIAQGSRPKLYVAVTRARHSVRLVAC